MGQIYRGTENLPQSPFAHKVSIWCVSALKIQLSSEIAVGQSKFTVYYFLVVTLVQYNLQTKAFFARDLKLSIV